MNLGDVDLQSQTTERGVCFPGEAGDEQGCAVSHQNAVCVSHRSRGTCVQNMLDSHNPALQSVCFLSPSGTFVGHRLGGARRGPCPESRSVL